MKRNKRVNKGREKSRGKAGGARSKGPVKKAGRKSISLMASADERKAPYRTIAEVLGLFRPMKKPVTIRLDADVLAWFKKDGTRYQTRINLELRKAMEREMKEAEK